MEKEIRWQQRFSNYNKAFKKLQEGILYIRQNNPDFAPAQKTKTGHVLSDLVRQGLIQSFEYTHELAWNVMKDYATYQGNAEIRGPRDATREAFGMGLITDGEVWMEMIRSRNNTSHTYNEEIASGIYSRIITDFYAAFAGFQAKIETLIKPVQGEIKFDE